MKHEKAPTAPRFEGVLTISYMPMFWKIKAFGQFWTTSGGRNCQKAHLYAKTFHYAYSQVSTTISCKETRGKTYVSKNRCLWTFCLNSAISVGRIWPKLSKGTSTGQDLSFEHIYRSLRPSVADKRPGKAHVSKNRYFGHFGQIRPFPVNLVKTVKRQIYRPRPFR